MSRSAWFGILGAGLLVGCGGEVRIEPTDLDLLHGQAVSLKVFQGDEDVTAKATFKVDGDALEVEGSTLGAHMPGSGTLHVTVGGTEVTAKATVEPLDEIWIEVPEGAEWTVGSEVDLSIMGRHGEKIARLGHDIAFDMSDDRIVDIDESGRATVKGAGSLVLKATVGDHTSAEVTANVTCAYPEGDQDLGFGNVMPNLSWPAIWPDGTKGTLDMAQMSCPGQWGDTKSILFVFSAGWCKPCTAYAQYLMTQKEALEQAHMQVVIMELQDYEGNPADTKFAAEHLEKITNDNSPGIATGDKSTTPEKNFVGNSGWIQYFPTTMVVRTRDMKIIADAYKAGTYFMPMTDIASDPEADWTFGGVFTNRCKLGEEEPGEPNNTGDRAIPVGAGQYRGGICDESGLDLYQVNVTGNYNVTLNFAADRKTNLDIWVWDAETNTQKVIDGSVVGSTNGTGEESFDHSGPALIAVRGVAGSSAPYTLTITQK